MSIHRLLSISVAPGYGAGRVRVDEAKLVEGHGIEGDRYAGSTRQVTLVCTGEIEAAAEMFGEPMDPFETRRNLVVDVPELPRTHGSRIGIGDVELEVWRDCAPCEVMEQVFGDGAKEALKRRAGVSARILRGGVVHVGDPVTIAANE